MTILDEALALLKTRDLRFYGLYAHDNRDATAQYLTISATPFDAAANATLAGLYSEHLPAMEPVEQGSILAKLRRCPAIPTAPRTAREISYQANLAARAAGRRLS